MRPPLMTTNLSLPNRRSGKVRDIYSAKLASGEPGVLIVANDRISAFDVVMSNGLPGKGIVLTQISRFWFEHFASSVKHHLISTDTADVPGLTEAERTALAGRIMQCRKVDVVPIECIARGYITGSGWKDYQKTGAVCGIPLPKGLRNGDRLPEPIFTPSTKAETGHDENISFEQGADVVGADLMCWLRDTTLDLYNRAAVYAMQRGIILADTKFEFGQIAGKKRRCWSTRFSRLTVRASGPPTSGVPVASNRVSTSNACATIWRRW
jgi:phosphoribosylaminoimidazole-succinocarboxamide synthase